MRRVQPKDVRFDLPAGTEVEITIAADESNLAAVYADVPMLDTQFELETAGGIRGAAAGGAHQDAAPVFPSLVPPDSA